MEKLGNVGRPRQRTHETALKLATDLSMGAGLGAFIGVGCWLLGLWDLAHMSDMFAITGVCGAIIGATRAQVALRALGVVTLFALVVVGYTPLVARLLAPRNCSDPIARADAVVVLGSAIHRGGGLNSEAQDRLLQAVEVVRAGYAAQIVITNAASEGGQEGPAELALIRRIGLTCPVIETGPVYNTHDEALAVAGLASTRHWSGVILVTHAWHMRRAAAVFEKLGLKVIRCPCAQSSYDSVTLNSPYDRFCAFADWLHEFIGYKAYQFRGWV